MMKELDVFHEALSDPVRPMLASTNVFGRHLGGIWSFLKISFTVIGGKKVKSKLKLIRHLLTKVLSFSLSLMISVS